MDNLDDVYKKVYFIADMISRYGDSNMLKCASECIDIMVFINELKSLGCEVSKKELIQGNKNN